jgi:hypothetical protein
MVGHAHHVVENIPLRIEVHCRADDYGACREGKHDTGCAECDEDGVPLFLEVR